MKLKLLFYCLLGCCTATAQQTFFHGNVKDAVTRKLLAGVAVKNRHSGMVAATGTDGGFRISADLGDTLLFTRVGYRRKTIIVSRLNDTAVLLEQQDNALEDVTVHTGYQALKPNEATGSYTVIDNKLLNQQTGTNILQRLNGVTSSLLFNVGKQNNNPQNNTGISIRGLSTINGPLDPLIVVDNFIYDGDIGNINPNDVESVTILKDAAAASIWGARAGNGVIVITTKKGKFNEKLKVDFNTDVIVTGKPDLYYLPQVPSSGYIDFEQYLFNQGYYNNLFTDDSHPAVSPATQLFEDRKNGLITAQDSATQIDAMKKTDNRKQFTKYFYRKGLLQQYALNLRGGGNNIGWLVSGTYDKSIGNLHDQYDKINLRFENTYRPLKNLDINAGVYYTGNKTVSGMQDYRQLISINNKKQVPYMNLVGPGGGSIAVPHYYNQSYIDTAGGGKLMDWNYYPLEDYKHGNITNRVEELLAHVGIDYRIMPGIDISLMYQYQKQRTDNDNISDTASYYARNLINLYSQINPATGQVTYVIPVGGVYIKNNNQQNSYNFRAQLNAERTIGHVHHISALAGMEVRDNWATGYNSVYYGYNADPLTYTSNLDFKDYYVTYMNNYAYIPGTSGLSATENRFVSLFANGSYVYNGKYILSGSMRKDGSNIFGANTNDKWKPLWSSGLAWELSKERFYHASVFPFLKISVTYGVSGNVDLTKTAMPIALASTSRITGFKIEGVNSINNPDLSWERSYMLNLKLDFRTAGNILNGSVEYYHKKGTNLYSPTPYDYTTWGLSGTVTANVADMKGRGVDVVLHSNNLEGAVKWGSDFLLNYNTSTVTKYEDPQAMTVTDLIGNGGALITPVVGKPLYAIVAYKWGGLDAQGNPQGYLDGKLSTDYLAIKQSARDNGLASGSFRYVGPANPVTFGSLMNTVSYKNISLSFNITYKLGYYLFRSSLSYSGFANNGIGGSDYAKRWQKAGDEKHTNVPAFVYPFDDNRDAFYQASEVNVIRGDHIRLQFINLAYSFLGRQGKLPFSNLQVYANAANLGILWRANKYGIDPDFANAVPVPKTFTIGIRAGF